MDGAEPPFSLLEVDQGLENVPAPEIRPEDRGDPDLRVGDLPEEKVGDPKLAARPDEEVGVGDPGRVEMPGKGLLVQEGRVHVSLPARFFLHRIDDLRPAAVVEGQDDGQPVEVPGEGFDPLQLSFGRFGDLFSPADDQNRILFFIRSLSCFRR